MVNSRSGLVVLCVFDVSSVVHTFLCVCSVKVMTPALFTPHCVLSHVSPHQTTVSAGLNPSRVRSVCFVFVTLCHFVCFSSLLWVTTTRASCPNTAHRPIPPRASEGSLECRLTVSTRYILCQSRTRHQCQSFTKCI